MTFTKAQLVMSDAEQAALTRQLASTAQPDPIAQVMAEEAARVGLICDAYALPEAWLTRLCRALVVYSLYSRTGAEIPKQAADAYTEAQKDLTDIREGKYQNFLKTTGTMASSANLPASVERVLTHQRADQAGL